MATEVSFYSFNTSVNFKKSLPSFSTELESEISVAVGNVSGNRCESDCRSRGRDFDPGPVQYFPED